MSNLPDGFEQIELFEQPEKPKKKRKKKQEVDVRVLDLFSGIGGIALAAHWAGMETVAFCEIEPFCQKVLSKNFPGIPIYDDVTKLTREQLEKDGVIDDSRGIDAIFGGIPCQPFSIAGKQKGKDDERHLWPEMFRLIRELQPRWVLVENVTGFIRLALDDVLNDLESENYKATTIVLPAHAVGAPHKRERIFIVAHSSVSKCNTRTKEQRVLREVQRDRSKQHHTDRSSETFTAMANTNSDGNNSTEKHRADRNRTEKMQEWYEPQRRSSDNSETLANSSRSRQQECNTPTFTEGKRLDTRCSNEDRRTGAIEPRVGGMLDGVSSRMDQYRLSHRWPALLGESQYEWEPSRVSTVVKNRKDRLKALGNAVVPQQIYPILKAMMKDENKNK